MDWLVKAMLTGAGVALLLAAVQLWGRRFAGLVTGLPTVTAPALAWLALARGPGFAAEAAAGSIAASTSCALFATGYALASRRARPLAALAAGGALALTPLPLLAHWHVDVVALMLLSVLACAACAKVLRTPPDAPPAPGRSARTRSQVGVTACTAALVSGAVSLLAGDVGAFWSGMLASAPLIAAVVGMRLHLDEGSAAVAPFMRGYLGGLLGRNCFAALFGLLVAPVGVGLPVLVG
jgi:hypothetical protein